MKKLLILSIMIPFLAYSQSNEIKMDRNNHKYIVHKNEQGNITRIVPTSGVDYSAEIKSVNIPQSSSDNPASSNWQLKFQYGGRVFEDISFATPLVGYISTEKGCIQKTTDGGNSWNKVLDLDFPYYWYGVYALTVDTLIISGFNDQAATTDGIVRWSYDGGKSWTNDIILSLPYNPGVGWLSKVHFWNKNVGIVANEWGGGFYWTSNGGKDWSSWHFVLEDPAKGWFQGTIDFKADGNIFVGGISQGHSTDFGHTWTTYTHVDPIFDGNTNFDDKYRMTGLTAGGEISPSSLGWLHKTTNGGQTWGPRILNLAYSIRSVKVFNESFFLAMGGAVNASLGGIYSTTDGGATWNLDQNTSAEMWSYTISYPTPDSLSIWCVGSDALNGYTGKLYKKTISSSFFSTITLTALLQGFYNGSTMVSDTVTLELHNASSPYALIESKKGVLNSSGIGTFNFANALNATPYYLVIKHRNSIETWSASTPGFSSNTLSYDFTSAQNKAYGNNQVIKGSKWCLYSGDANHDGIIDSGDLAVVDNDNSNYVSGYTNTDINGDGIIDSGDLAIVDNNNSNYVGKVFPADIPAASRIKSPGNNISSMNEKKDSK